MFNSAPVKTVNVQLGDARVIYVSACSCIQNKASKYHGNSAGVQLLLCNCKYLSSYLSIKMQTGYSDSLKFMFPTVFSYYFCSFCCLSRVLSSKHTNRTMRLACSQIINRL